MSDLRRLSELNGYLAREIYFGLPLDQRLIILAQLLGRPVDIEDFDDLITACRKPRIDE